jgi:hypothetical protein
MPTNAKTFSIAASAQNSTRKEHSMRKLLFLTPFVNAQWGKSRFGHHHLSELPTGTTYAIGSALGNGTPHTTTAVQEFTPLNWSSGELDVQEGATAIP